jgi:hypothetical protein
VPLRKYLGTGNPHQVELQPGRASLS